MQPNIFNPTSSALTPKLRELIRSKARELQGSEALATFGILNAIVIAINLKRVRVSVDGKRWQPPILMPMAVSSSGGGKSPAMWTALRPFVRHDLAAVPKFKQDLAHHFAEVAAWKREGRRLEREYVKTCTRAATPKTREAAKLAVSGGSEKHESAEDADTVVADTVVADTVDADTVVADTVVADTVVADTVVADTVVADAVVADAVVADAVVTAGDGNAEPCVASATSLSEIEAALAAHEKNPPRRPRSTQVIFNTSSHAGLIDHASQGGLIALMLDDGYGVRKAGILDGRFAQWYSGLPITDVTRTHGIIDVAEPRMVAAVAFPRSELREHLTANGGAFRYGGMPCRFLVFRSDDDYGWRDFTPASEMDLAVVQAFERWLTRCLEDYATAGGMEERVDVRFSAEAAFLLNRASMQIERESGMGALFGDVPDAARKACDHIIRLAACIELFETANLIVSPEAVQAAIEIVRACLLDFDAVMGCSDSATILGHRAPRLLRWLMNKLPFGHAVPEKLLRAACHFETCPKELWEPVLIALEMQKIVLRRKGFIALNHAAFGAQIPPPPIQGAK